jgi:hypothetical protein
MSTANNQVSHIDFKFLKDTGMTGADERDNAFGAGGKLYSIFINNSSGGATAGYLKLYDTALAVTEGTTVPDFCFKVTNERHLLQFPEGITFSNGLGYTISTGKGTTAGSAVAAVTNPTVFTFK